MYFATFLKDSLLPGYYVASHFGFALRCVEVAVKIASVF
jgi:hypothetical protein